jgi:hypothetical protein
MAVKRTVAVAALIAFAVSAQTDSDSLAHFRTAETLLIHNDFQSAAAEFTRALEGNREPAWTEVLSHMNLGKIYDITGQCDRALTEYELASGAHGGTRAAKDEIDAYLNLRSIRAPGAQPDAGYDLDPPPGVRRPGNGVTVPELIQTRPPEYSAEARLAGPGGKGYARRGC